MKKFTLNQAQKRILAAEITAKLMDQQKADYEKIKKSKKVTSHPMMKKLDAIDKINAEIKDLKSKRERLEEDLKSFVNSKYPSRCNKYRDAGTDEVVASITGKVFTEEYDLRSEALDQIELACIGDGSGIDAKALIDRIVNFLKEKHKI